MNNINRKEQILSGELLVVGKDKLEIHLGKGHPTNVIVELRNCEGYTPCNPHHDKVSWIVQEHKHGFTLTIEWDVSGAKEICWSVVA